MTALRQSALKVYLLVFIDPTEKTVVHSTIFAVQRYCLMEQQEPSNMFEWPRRDRGQHS
jgi:hypothetical protein